MFGVAARLNCCARVRQSHRIRDRAINRLSCVRVQQSYRFLVLALDGTALVSFNRIVLGVGYTKSGVAKLEPICSNTCR